MRKFDNGACIGLNQEVVPGLSVEAMELTVLGYDAEQNFYISLCTETKDLVLFTTTTDGLIVLVEIKLTDTGIVVEIGGDDCDDDEDEREPWQGA